MFSLINAARLYKINPDNALELTNQKFIRRFNYLEEHTIKAVSYTHLETLEVSPTTVDYRIQQALKQLRIDLKDYLPLLLPLLFP